MAESIPWPKIRIAVGDALSRPGPGRRKEARGPARVPLPESGKAAKGPAFHGEDGRCGERRRNDPAIQRLENWKLRRAFALPYFLRSTTRLSRVRKPPFLSTVRRAGS